MQDETGRVFIVKRSDNRVYICNMTVGPVIGGSLYVRTSLIQIELNVFNDGKAIPLEPFWVSIAPSCWKTILSRHRLLC